MEITYTTEFVRKERTNLNDRWGDEEETYYECPNCGEECDAYNAEERGRGVHTITECFEVMRQKFTKLFEAHVTLLNTLESKGVIERAAQNRPEPTLVDMGKAERVRAEIRSPIITLDVSRWRRGEERQGKWVGTTVQLANRIIREESEGWQVQYQDAIVERAVERIKMEQATKA
mgnify:CR=1 FL=1